MTPDRKRKPFAERALTVRSASRRHAAGSRRNKRHHFVGTFASDRRSAA